MFTPDTPARAAIVMIQSAARNRSTILPVSQIPNQMITSGISASGGTGRMNSTMGSNQPRTQLESPMAYPSGIPTMAPATNPPTTRSSDQPKCSQSVKF